MTARRYRYEDPQTQYENSAEFRSITDRNKITIKFHRGRLCCWPGNVQRWIHPDNSGEVSVDGVPVLGHVIATRMNQGPLTDTILTASVPKALWPNIANGMPVVINRQQLPAHVANLI